MPETQVLLSAGEQKKIRRAEKSARREGKKLADESTADHGSVPPNELKESRPELKGKNLTVEHRNARISEEQQGHFHRRTSSSTVGCIPKHVVLKGKPSNLTSSKANKESKRDRREVALFGHLYGHRKRTTIEGAPKEVHPAVLALGLQMSNYIICGSNARCVAMLVAFQKVIESYTTPPGTSLARHLTSHHLSPQIDFLRSCRPISISMGNAIRWLKEQIIKIDPAVPEEEAKMHLMACIDTFIRERITAADAVISETASAKVYDGDVVLTYAHSSVVADTILAAHRKGTRFRVIVVDSRPLFEGRRLARKLSVAGISVSYTLVSAAAHVITDANRVLLGAHAMLGNGRLYSRIGTAAIAMLAHERDIPVIICCESVKFSDRVALDSIVGNEIAPAEELVIEASNTGVHSTELVGKADQALAKEKWDEMPNVQMLNILYDVTPAEYITMVVTELGSLPPSSVPVVHRISTNG